MALSPYDATFVRLVARGTSGDQMTLPRLACGIGCIVGVVACGAAPPRDVPEGTHHGYVVSSVSVPTNDAEATQFGFDLGNKTSSELDGVVDNAIGHALAGVTGLNFDIQSPITAAVDIGSILLLIDLQTKDFTASNAVGFGIKLGANPMPAPCSSSTDTICRRHLDGTGTFSIADDSPADVVVAGRITSGTFTGGPDDIPVQIAVGSPTPITLNLLHARAQATTLSETGIMSATIGGLVTVDDVNTQVGPAIAVSIESIIEHDCPVPAGDARVPPDCSCKRTGLTVIHALDGKASGSIHDCKITTDEVLGFPFIKPLLQPDACSKDRCQSADSLSIGIKVEAVKATFPM
jgi:hypothetical protein